MIQVYYVLSAEGWLVTVHAQGKSEVKFGPFTDGERDSFIEGAKVFAHPLFVNFSE